MATSTPDTITRTNLGSMDAYIFEFPATADDTNTHDTGINNIRWAFASQEDTAGTAAATGAGVSWSGSTITLHIGETNSAVNVLVLAGGA